MENPKVDLYLWLYMYNLTMFLFTYHVINGLQVSILGCVRVNFARIVVVAVICVVLCRDSLGSGDLDLDDLAADGPAESVVRVASVLHRYSYGSQGKRDEELKYKFNLLLFIPLRLLLLIRLFTFSYHSLALAYLITYNL